MLKLVLGALLCACAAVPAIAVANCDSPSAALAGPGVQSVYENAGIYEWNEGLQAWVLVEAAYVPFFETETLRPGDEYIAPEVLWGAEGGGSGGGYLVQGGGTQPRRGQGRGGAGQPGIACAESPKELPPVVVTGSRPSFGRLIALFWRGQLLNAARGPGAVQRPVSDAVTVLAECRSTAEERQATASLAYRLHFGTSVLAQARRDRGQNYRITFTNGASGVYQRDNNPDGRASVLFNERIAPKCG